MVHLLALQETAKGPIFYLQSSSILEPLAETLGVPEDAPLFIFFLTFFILLIQHGVALGIDELMLMTLAGSLFNSSIRIQSSVKRLTYTYPTKDTCITKLVHYEGKCPVFLTLIFSGKFSGFAAALGAAVMFWVAIAVSDSYMTI
jgi:hypothetical protein